MRGGARTRFAKGLSPFPCKRLGNFGSVPIYPHQGPGTLDCRMRLDEVLRGVQSTPAPGAPRRAVEEVVPAIRDKEREV